MSEHRFNEDSENVFGVTIGEFGHFNQFQVDFAESLATLHPLAGNVSVPKVALGALPLLAEARRIARDKDEDVLLSILRWAKTDQRVARHLDALSPSELTFTFGMVEIAARHWQSY